jgi:hypothetical protein|nr:MAG TPA: hypothetical protein [Podoviridae sp. ctgHy19]
MNEITSIEQLAQYSMGQVVQFPDFAEGQPFVARIKRPSMLVLAKTGQIPNALLTKANSLFVGKGINDKDTGAMKDLFKILDVICEACFVEPTYQQIKESGIELTDEQLMFIFNYTQKGVQALDSFRVQSKHSEHPIDSSAVQETSI